MMHTLVNINKKIDIPKQYQDTPVGLLLEYHNLSRPVDKYSKAKILIGMCMDNRKHLRIPDNFAYIIRSGGANLRYSEFKISYAIAIGGVRYIALIGHNRCGMVNLFARKKAFIRGLVMGAGWSMEHAEDHFMNLALMHEIEDEVEFAFNEAIRLGKKYPKIKVAPLLYRIEDNKLYCII